MSKLDDLKRKVDSQEGRVDGWLARLQASPHTGRAIAVMVFFVLIGLVWLVWLR